MFIIVIGKNFLVGLIGIVNVIFIVGKLSFFSILIVVY